MCPRLAVVLPFNSGWPDRFSWSVCGTGPERRTPIRPGVRIERNAPIRRSALRPACFRQEQHPAASEFVQHFTSSLMNRIFFETFSHRSCLTLGTLSFIEVKLFERRNEFGADGPRILGVMQHH